MRLPQPARILLPHQPPMVCIDRLLEAGEDRGLCEVRLVEGHTLLDAKGRLEPCGFVELAAQSVAALKGWERVRRGLPLPLGFLVGVQDFVCSGAARVGDTLRIETVSLGVFEGFGVVRAHITRGETVLAQGRIKLYTPNGAEEE